MPDNFRRFQAGPDPFGRTWEVEFRWLQNGISIRHSDTIDAKFIVWTNRDGIDTQDGEEKQERIIALPHPLLLALSKRTGHAITDGWCIKLAALHLKATIASGDDMEKTIITVSAPDLDRAAGGRQAA